MNVQAKFTCQAMTKRKNWNVDQPYVYDYEFSAVTGNSEENKRFFGSTPSGEIKLRAVRDDLYEPGKDYYIEFRPAEPVE
jgi:hypothetical protein